MKLIQETFLETDWEDEATARAERDARAEQLQAQGLVCTREDLDNVRGDRVFLLEAAEPEAIAPPRKIADLESKSTSATEQKPVPRPGKLRRKALEYEIR
jgi:hypothetical protein